MAEIVSDGERNLAALKEHYRRYPIVLYTGAGVSFGKTLDRKPKGVPRRIEYGLPGWPGLLQRIFRERPRKTTAPFRPQRGWPKDLWATTDWVVRQCGGARKFQETLVRTVQEEQNFTQAYRQLSGPFLSVAPTLEAVVAFCARLLEQKESAAGDRDIYHRVGPNPRIRAVVTSNYDPFLESASSTMFRDPILKPVAAHGSLAGDLREIPVFHIHGYVPHPWQKPGRREIKPLRKNLVLTKKDYDEAWKRRDVFGPTMSPQIHYLRHYVTLFVGFSFDDEYVCKLLRNLKKAEESYGHFALMKKDEVARRGEKFFARIGVNPIDYADHGDIPDKLGEIYKAGLGTDYRWGDICLPLVAKRTRAPRQGNATLTSDAYWNVLRNCRNEGVDRRSLSP